MEQRLEGESVERGVRRAMAMTVGLLVAAVSLAGCRGAGSAFWPRDSERLVSPFAFKRVAVLPFINLSGETAPECEQAVRNMWTLFHAELQRVRGLQVVPPGAVTDYLRRGQLKISSPREVFVLARALDADAVVVGAVTSYDPYYKPRVGVALQVYQRRPRAQASPDILAMAERGRPFPVGRGGASEKAPVAVLDRIYDSGELRIDQAVRRFAKQRDALGSAFGSERYFHDMEKYLSFVSRQAIVDLIAAERRRQKEEKKRLKEEGGSEPEKGTGGRS